MKNRIEFQSAEKKFLIDREDLAEAKMQQMLFSSPLDFFKKIRDGYLSNEGDPLKADNQFINKLPLLIGCLQENFYNFSYMLPEDVLQVLNGDDDDPQTRIAMIILLKNSGVTKEGVRAWVIEDFAKHTPQTDLQTKIESSSQQLEQLQLIEKIYGNN